jgi:hypothetical protein
MGSAAGDVNQLLAESQDGGPTLRLDSSAISV